MTTWTVDENGVPRNYQLNPGVMLPGTDKMVPYTRSSKLGDMLEDMSNVEKWKMRLTAKGMSLSDSLLLEASMADLDRDKQHLNDIAYQALDKAGGNEASKTGTLLHKITELLDTDEDVTVPAKFVADIEAYRRATSRFEMVHVEPFMVCDDLRIAGTPDRLMYDPMSDGDPLIVGDLKTGSSEGFLGKHSVQLAIYSHSVLYDPATGTRTPLNINQQTGVIFHMPAGQGVCNLFELDLVAGWEGALKAQEIKAWRSKKKCKPLKEMAAA